MQRAVLFDLDGTLLDTLGDIADAVNAALRALRLPEHPEARVRAEYDRHLDARTRPYPGVETLLEGLSRRGVPAAVLTNKLQHLAEATVARHFSRWPFRAILGETAGRPLKPDPGGALWGFRERAELEAAGARRLATSPVDVLALLA